MGGDLIGVSIAIRMPGDLHTTIQARLTTASRADIRQGFLAFDSWARDLLKKNPQETDGEEEGEDTEKGTRVARRCHFRSRPTEGSFHLSLHWNLVGYL